MSNARIEVVHQIDTLLLTNCLECPKQPGRNRSTDVYSTQQKYCTNICPIGLELRSLGNSLNGLCRKRKSVLQIQD